MFYFQTPTSYSCFHSPCNCLCVPQCPRSRSTAFSDVEDRAIPPADDSSDKSERIEATTAPNALLVPTTIGCRFSPLGRVAVGFSVSVRNADKSATIRLGLGTASTPERLVRGTCLPLGVAAEGDGGMASINSVLLIAESGTVGGDKENLGDDHPEPNRRAYLRQAMRGYENESACVSPSRETTK